LSLTCQQLAFPGHKLYEEIVKFLGSNGSCLWRVGGLALCVGFLLSGCGRNDVQVYRVEKDPTTAPASQQTAALPPGHPDTGAAAPPSIKWTQLPADWQVAPPGQMRVAAFRVQGKDGKQADLGVVPLPGVMGHDLENVNRWRGTVGLAPVTEADLAKLGQPVGIGGETGQLYDQAGENPGSGEKTRILVAVAHHDGVAWYFKMNGDDDLVSQQKSALIDFLKSVTFVSTSTQADLPTSRPLLSSPDSTPPPGPASSGSTEGRPSWNVPPGWQEIAGGPFLVAKFSVGGNQAPQTTVNVSTSPGEGGGLAMNVNRWRGQVGLSPLSDTDLSKQITLVDTPAGKAKFVDMAGMDAKSGQKVHLVGAVISRAGQTWFYKLMGNEQVVEQQKEAFTKFVQTVKYP
jgi:hypothetical protein